MLCRCSSISEDYFVSILTKTHVTTINEKWPHKFPNSEALIWKLIDANGGIGIFSKSTNELCAWVLKNFHGGLGVLQVTETERRKGLGTLVTKIFSRRLAEDGLDIVSIIKKGNLSSENLFGNLGFKQIVNVITLKNYQS